MKIKKSLISAMMVSAMVLGGTGAVFASGNDDVSNIELSKFKSLVESGVTDAADLEKHGVEYYTYEEYAKQIEELKAYAKDSSAVKDVSSKDLEDTIKIMEKDLEKIKTEGLKIMKPIVIDNEDGTQLAVSLSRAE
ncbi:MULTISPECIES: hypothetical protein [unclassified Clostridioides]|uniref:hypothetical protein n=1 Tax=unclassified Clostridioides TaxID=2635829 RepID=UPI001D0CB665|nr:hypothetical protein [Clostridioides sp. ES-S-0001-02]MCC0640999.1 hypothetical protein [Clostridioides sp. ES-S-0049-03]MCC0654583.1 hypothetical protein [Clostridioides sp. ES-S-0001-03]MCC0656460.1 hypothetical protein [Clostridioides sp. ES-S-0123-01]MCC0671868.1 hypothetical protein [Clostridioides sp. ES-S-0145-01]MCC0675830.1 hypothetical protein [Clostridioides sp. ES-W-0018-02]MCC0681166.1 hypothetical protein [Clostridioides sp. ES-S-0005-03]MCC0696948.1 hypothetical protein [Cl